MFGNAKRHKKQVGIIRKILITISIMFAFTISTAYAEDSGNLETVFHVYLDGEHIGKVDNKEAIETLMDKKIAAKESELKGYTLTIGQDVFFVAERVFKPTYNTNLVTNTLKKELSVKAEATELKIGDNTVGFFKDRDTAEESLKSYKAKFVDEKTLEKLSDEKQNNPEKNKLASGESIITDVKLSKKVSYADEKVALKEVLTKKQGVKMLEKGTLEDKIHHVKKGEVLGDIAAEYDLSLDKLIDLNEGLTKDSTIQIDQEIHVTDYKPFVDVIVKKEEIVDEVIDYSTEVIKSDSLYKGDKNVKQKGQEGKNEVHYSLKLKNGQVVNKEVVNKKKIKDPVKKIIVKGTKVVPSRGTGDLHWPAVGGYISSGMGARWGTTHKGIDIAGPSNRSILAADNGTVVSAGWNSGGYGNKIVISHNNGMKTVYAHLASIRVNAGQTVEKGSKIGVMGTTGNSTGIHLHFEVYKNGALQNPKNYF